MKQQVAQQARQINQLQHEKDTLGQRLKDMQGQTAGNKQLKDTIAKLQQQLKCESYKKDDYIRSKTLALLLALIVASQSLTTKTFLVFETVFKTRQSRSEIVIGQQCI